ncbi:MAG: 30S ribosomal protein S2, partial [Candidatus Saccharimonadales bacterium]
IKDLNGKPGAVFIIDVVDDRNAVNEARKMGLPIVALVDSNADPTLANYPIPANDDAIKSLELLVSYVQQAIELGKSKVKSNEEKPVAKALPEDQKPIVLGA